MTLKNEVDVDALLEARGERAFLAGKVRGLGQRRVFNRKDFIYALAFDPRARVVAYTHHVATHMELTLADLKEDAKPRFTTKLNPSEFDVEGLKIVERDGALTMVSASRQGGVRLHNETGEQQREFVFGTALTRLAVNPSATLLAAGTADGRVLLLDASDLAFRGASHGHKSEVRDLRFVDDSGIISTSFDGEIVHHLIEPGGPDVARVSSSELEGGARVFIAHVEGSRAVATTRDARQPVTVVNTAVAKRLGLKTLDKEATVMTPVGEQQRPVVEVPDLQVRYIGLGSLEAAVCDECVPAGAELVLGQTALARVVIGDDPGAGEVMVRLSAEVPPDVTPAVRVAGALKLLEVARVKLPGPGTALDVARDGTVLASYSHAKAERTKDIYDAEQEGNLPPPSPASGAVLVDLKAGALGKRFIGHEGFTFAAAISPDGKTVATGGWDNRVILFDVESGQQVEQQKMGWIVRELTFSRDGRFLGVAAWTKTNALGSGDSDPAMVVFDVVFWEPAAKSGARPRG